MADLAIIVPTRGRPENVRKVINAWSFTNAWEVADLILAVDEDDPEYGGYVEILDDMAEMADRRHLRIFSIASWGPMVEKLNTVATIFEGDYFALGFAGDDHLPQTINWAQRYLTVLRELKTGMVYGDDGYQGAKLSTEWAVTSDVVRALGRMVPAPVEHMYCDNSMMDLFGGAGALRHLPEIRIEHMHPIAGKADSDDQYQRVNSRDQFSRDRKAYERWVRLELPSQIAMIRSMRPDAPDVPVIGEKPVSRRPQRNSRIAARSGPTQRKSEMNRFPFTAELKHVRGATPDEIGMTLADYAVRVPADQEIVELGVFQGRTALIMAWGARQGNGAHVTAIDPWDLPGNVYDPPFTEPESKAWAEYRIRELGYSDSITLIQGFSEDVARTVFSDADGKPFRSNVGLLYVDGDHTKEGARRDIEAWAPHLAPGAVIAVDDYGHPDWPGVGEAVDELVAEGFLAPIEIFHDRLAVTRLTEGAGERSQRGEAPRAITSEGVSPSPYPAAEGQVAVDIAPGVTEVREPRGIKVTTHTFNDDGTATAVTETLLGARVTYQDNNTIMVENDPAYVRHGELDDKDTGRLVADLNEDERRQLDRIRGLVPTESDSAPSTEDFSKVSLGDLRARVRALHLNPKGMDRAALIAAIQVAG